MTVVLKDFHAEWCGPCKQQEPVLEELKKEMSGVKFEDIDVDKESDKAQEHGVMSIPTLIIEKDGEEVDRMVGFQDKATLKKKLESHL